jgi:hypothetical protein
VQHGRFADHPPARIAALGRSGTVAVLVTAVVTWAILALFEVVPIGGFLLQGTIAVLGGAAVGLLVPWYRARQRRQAT